MSLIERTKEIVALASAGKIDANEADRQLAMLTAPSPGSVDAEPSITTKGGLYYKNRSIQSWSEDKGKAYVPGLNCTAELAIHLFRPTDKGKPNPVLQKIMDFVAKEFKTAA